METKDLSRRKVIEADVLDEYGRPVHEEPNSPRSQTCRQAGVLTGFVALAFSFVMILAMALVTVFVVVPLMLLGRLLGLQIKNLHR